MSDDLSGNSIVERLFGSFQVLEQAIIGARETLYTRPGVSPQVLSRLDSYSDLLEKQKCLATELRILIDGGKWSEVAQKIAIINGLLEMIRNDAKEVLEMINGISEDTQDEDKPSTLIC